jgi:UDP-N-acetylmuramoyl-tripeptide--D-alanyl-D-alanine ligase
LEYPVLGDNPRADGNGQVEKYKSFTLRNGGNDNETTRLRDPFFQRLGSGLNYMTQTSTPCVVFLNGEDENIEAHRSHVTGRAIRYGLNDGCDYYATDISASSRGTTFTVHTPKGECETLTAGMIGKHNVVNILGGIAVCCEMGIPLRALKMQTRKLQSVPHRLQLLPKGGGVTVIDDAYNANPAGTRAAIDALALFDGFKVLVTPGMVELGDKQDELNRAFGAYAAKVCDYVILVGKKQAPPILEGLRDAGYPEEKIYVAEALADAVTRAYSLDAGGREKIILLENDLPDNF